MKNDQMINAFSPGSEYGHIPGPPVNEDYSMMMVVTAVFEGVVTAVKAWDTGNTKKQYQARLLWNGKPGTPPDSAIKSGSNIVFYRVGEFENAGSSGFELHTEDVTKTSWICFAEQGLTFVKDLGEGVGVEVVYENGAFSPPSGPWNTKNLKPLDPLAQFHDSTPPYVIDRVYLAISVDNYFLVFLPGHGDELKTLDQAVSGTTYSIHIDGQGNVLDFTTA